MTFRNRARNPISIGRAGAPFVASVVVRFGSFTVRPSILSSRSGMESATRSTTFSFTASRSVIATAWRTAFSAQSALRPRSSETVRMNATASFSIFFIIVLSAPPPSATGEAAPMLVAGAIAATWAAIVMKTPAEAARAPVGATNTMTGNSAFIMRWTIARIARSSPPGVSSWMTSAWARSAWARSIARPTSRSVTGLITPSISIVATGAGAAHASPVNPMIVASATRPARTAGGLRKARPGLIVASATRPARTAGGLRKARPGFIAGAPGDSRARRGDWRRAAPSPDLGRRTAARPRRRPRPRAPGPPAPAPGRAPRRRSGRRRPVEVLRAEVFVPGIWVGVEVDEAQAPVAARERAQEGERDRVIAADTHGDRPVRDHLADARLDGGQRALDRDRHDVHVAAVGHAQPLERVDLEHGIPRTDQR